MTLLRIGVMGCADVASRMVVPAINSIPCYKLVAAASRSRTKAEHFSAAWGCEPIYGYDNLIMRNDIDAIYMPLPTGLHRMWALEALRSGKHLLIEKSLAMNLEDAVEITSLASAKKLVVVENYMFEHHSQQSVVRDLIYSELGEPRLFRAYFGFPPLAKDNFRYLAELGGGALLDAGGYVLKAVKVFFPSSTARVRSAILNLNAEGVDTWGTAMLDVIHEGSLIPAVVSFGFDNFYQCGIEVWGSEGKLTTDRTFTAGPTIRPRVIVERKEGVREIVMPADNHFRNLLLNFRSAIIEGESDVQSLAVLAQAKLQQEVRDLSSIGVGMVNDSSF